MTPCRLAWTAGLASALACGSHVAAQVPDTVMGDTLLAQGATTGVDQPPLTVFLRRHGQYRVLLSEPLMSVRAVPRKGGRPAFAAEVTPGQFAPYTILELHPYSTGEHSLTLTGFASTGKVHYWLWADREEELRARKRGEREWGIGLMVGLGYHTGYLVGLTDPAPARSSTDLDVGVVLGSSGILSGVLGIEYQTRYPGVENVLFVFAEPRVRVYKVHPRGLPLDIDLAVRIGQGNSSRTTNDPSMLGAGLVASRALNRRPGARGWRVSLSAMYHRLANIENTDDRSFIRGSVALSWLP
jgi:hypothetical protein